MSAIEEHPRPPRYAVVFTTYGWDSFVQTQFESHAARARSGDMHVVADESRGPVAVPAALSKMSATERCAAALGLRLAYLRRLFWQTIDYLYYVFYDRFPDYDYYVFLDYDARVEKDYDDFICEVHRRELDFVGAPIEGPLSDWVFGDAHAAIYDPAQLQACISAVTVLSNRALGHLFRRRREASAAPSSQQRAFWPICEAFVPTELAMAGFALADLGTFGDVKRFAWWPPTLDEMLERSASDAFVHPVLDRPRFVGSMLGHSPTSEFLRPRSRLWRTIRACPDRRWIMPFLTEAARRLRRVIVPGVEIAAVTAVGMRVPWQNAKAPGVARRPHRFVSPMRSSAHI